MTTENSWEAVFDKKYNNKAGYLYSGFIDAHEDIKSFIRKEIADAEQRGREEYRDHLRFVYRWISRLNGDKEHDKPEENWRSYVQTIVCYPLSPWETGDWFEEAARSLPDQHE